MDIGYIYNRILVGNINFHISLLDHANTQLKSEIRPIFANFDQKSSVGTIITNLTENGAYLNGIVTYHNLKS